MKRRGDGTVIKFSYSYSLLQLGYNFTPLLTQYLHVCLHIFLFSKWRFPRVHAEYCKLPILSTLNRLSAQSHLDQGCVSVLTVDIMCMMTRSRQIHVVR